MPNNLNSYQILLVSALSYFFGTFLAAIANTIFSAHSEKMKFTYQRIKGIFLTSMAIGILAGCATLAIGSVDRGYLESFSLLNIFLYGFFLSCFSGGGDTWIGVIKLVFKKVLTSNNTQ